MKFSKAIGLVSITGLLLAGQCASPAKYVSTSESTSRKNSKTRKNVAPHNYLVQLEGFKPQGTTVTEVEQELVAYINGKLQEEKFKGTYFNPEHLEIIFKDTLTYTLGKLQEAIEEALQDAQVATWDSYSSTLNRGLVHFMLRAIVVSQLLQQSKENTDIEAYKEYINVWIPFKGWRDKYKTEGINNLPEVLTGYYVIDRGKISYKKIITREPLRKHSHLIKAIGIMHKAMDKYLASSPK